MEIQEISAPVWANAEKTAIDCMVKFTELEFSVPYTATVTDSDDNGRFIFDWCINELSGVIADYVPSEEDQELAIALAEAEKARLMADAERVILPLERAVKHGIATSDEVARLELWELYSVELSRVDPSKAIWPETP
ncbi:TPA: tail fiber assembly protein [Citrobacter amalonaticus]|nr:tail fiber assembly protein [Citrobacter amalonaticus]